jgi:hypothetical protein
MSRPFAAEASAVEVTEEEEASTSQDAAQTATVQGGRAGDAVIAPAVRCAVGNAI